MLGGALEGAGDPAFAVEEDLNAAERPGQVSAGAYARDSFGLHYGEGVAGFAGAVPRIGVSSARDVGNSGFAVTLEDARPFADAVLVFGLEAAAIDVAGGALWNDAQVVLLSQTDVEGRALRPLPVPDDPSLAGEPFFVQWAVVDADAPFGVALTGGLRLMVE